jgi:predicted transcriptional regulator
MQVTIQISEELEQKLTERASQLNIPLETFILESLVQLVEPSDPDNTPNEVILEGFREGLQQALNGQTIPLSQMWDGIDAE